VLSAARDGLNVVLPSTVSLAGFLELAATRAQHGVPLLDAGVTGAAAADNAPTAHAPP